MGPELLVLLGRFCLIPLAGFVVLFFWRQERMRPLQCCITLIVLAYSSAVALSGRVSGLTDLVLHLSAFFYWAYILVSSVLLS